MSGKARERLFHRYPLPSWLKKAIFKINNLLVSTTYLILLQCVYSITFSTQVDPTKNALSVASFRKWLKVN